jgi:hypothetical protein
MSISISTLAGYLIQKYRRLKLKLKRWQNKELLSPVLVPGALLLLFCGRKIPLFDLKSIANRIEESFFRKITTGEHQGLVLGSIIPCSAIFSISDSASCIFERGTLRGCCFTGRA